MPQRFSGRLPADLQPNPITAALARHGRPAFDLTLSNPTLCGLSYPPDLLAALAHAAGLKYHPDPRGLISARAAVAGEYARHGLALDPGRIILTASTSEAYAFLFKLLCDPGEAVLVPSPSYPLFEHLARVEAVEALPYHLDVEHRCRIEVGELAAAGERVRAVIVVHPNNPTGSFVHPDDAAGLVQLCARRGWALIADEVFLDYPLGGSALPPACLAATADALTFTLGGLSKSVGLPQLKLAWIAASGSDELVRPALLRLELIADTFLSVGTPVQLALPALLASGASVRAAILERCRSNLAALASTLAADPALTLLAPEGGWSAVLRYPAVVDEEDLVLELLERESVAVHPGFFFDFPRDGYLVVSLLPPPDSFADGVRRIVRRIGTHL
ncbi:MAG: pyridoxal phosphate-dependent aminotransferase [Acidobacteriota bacterium]